MVAAEGEVDEREPRMSQTTKIRACCQKEASFRRGLETKSTFEGTGAGTASDGLYYCSSGRPFGGH